MWTKLIFVALFILRCAVSSSPPKPINVSFSSVNLRNVLHWSPGNDTPDGTHFTVQYAIYGTPVRKGKREHWRKVRQCENIVRTWCDLSAETSDEEEVYYARVRALGRKSRSKWTGTNKRFDPKSETIFGPPLVSVEIENNSAVVTLNGPVRYSPNNHTPAVTMKTICNSMSYNLSIFNTHRNQVLHFPVEDSLFKYHMMDYNTEYCFSAKSRSLSRPLQSMSSVWHCITTPQDPVIVQLQQMVVGIVVSSLCICIIVLVSYLLYNYLSGKGRTSPPVLSQPSFHSCPIVVLPENTTLQLTSIIPNKPPPEIESFIPCPPYAPQRAGVPQEPEEPMNNLSDDYASVVPKKVSGENTRQREPEEGAAVNNLKNEHQKNADCYEKKDIQIKDDNSSSGYKPQAKRFGQSPTQTEVSALLQSLPCSLRPPASPSQTQAPTQGNQRSFSDKQTKENNTESSALWFTKNAQTYPFTIHLNLPLLKEEEKREEIEGGEQEQNQCENVPLLSEYASQVIPTTPAVHSQKSDCLSDEYGALIQVSAQKAEAGDFKMEMCSNWNSENMQEMLPMPGMTFNCDERLGGMQSSDRGKEDNIGGTFEGTYMTRNNLKLENVLLRQTSDEGAGAQMEEEMDNILSKWHLVISNDD